MLELFLSHPYYQSNLANVHGKSATQIMCPFAPVKSVTSPRWVPMHVIVADTANRDFKSISMIQGRIYAGLNRNIVIYDLNLQEIKTLSIGHEIGEVYKIIYFKSGNSKDLLLTSEGGIFHLTQSGRFFA